MKVKDVDCKKLFAGDPNELKKALAIQNSTLVSLEPKEITRKARNCRQFRRDFGFITDSLTKEERHFPIAYSILLHKQAEQVRISNPSRRVPGCQSLTRIYENSFGHRTVLYN